MFIGLLPPYVSMEGFIGCCVFFWPVTYISATVAPIGVKFCTMVHIGPGQVFSILGAVLPSDPQIRNFGPKFWPFDREYLENGKSHRYTSIRAKHQLDDDRGFLKCKSRGSSPPPRVKCTPHMAGLCLADALVFLVFLCNYFGGSMR